MTLNWYLKKGEDVYGPSETAEIQELLKAKKVSSSDFVANGVEGPWQPISSFSEFKIQPIPISQLSTQEQGLTQENADLKRRVFNPTAKEELEDRNKLIEDHSAKYEGAAFYIGIIASILFCSLFLRDVSGWIQLLVVIVGTGAATKGWKEIQKKRYSAYDNESLAKEWLEYEDKKRMWQFATLGLVLIVVAVVAFNTDFRNALYGIVQTAGNAAKCVVASSSADVDSFIINGEADFGYTVKTKLTNSGDDGNLDVTASLNSSEGKWQRHQSVWFKKGETKDLRFGFHEPTINSTNVMYGVNCR